MFPSPCRDAISVYSRLPPRQWPAAASLDRRRAWLYEKRRALANLPPVFMRLLSRLREASHPHASVEATRPGPRAPCFLSRSLTSDARAFLRELFAGGPRAASVLDETVSGDRFGTDWIDGRWRIIAPRQTETLAGLAGLAHELGHVLSNGGRRRQSFREMVRSEALAMILEESVVAQVLAAREEKEEWFAYQRNLDRHNHYFFREEMRLVEGESESLLRPAFLFRESVWTSHGYQSVYAAASLIRSSRRSRDNGGGR